MRLKQFLQLGGRKYNDSFYDKTDIDASQKVGIPVDILRGIRLAGEKSNENQISSAGAKGVYQFIPSVRNSVLKKYGVDAWKPEESSMAAAYLLKENVNRNNGNYTNAIREYHGGIDRKNWGKINNAYINRVENFINNNSLSEIPSSEIRYADSNIYDKAFQDMKKGFVNHTDLNNIYSKNPEAMLIMGFNIDKQKDLIEYQKLEQERLKQEENKKIIDQQNEQISIALQQRESEKQQILSMIPQSQSVSSGNIKPGFMKNGGMIDIKNFFKIKN